MQNTFDNIRFNILGSLLVVCTLDFFPHTTLALICIWSFRFFWSSTLYSFWDCWIASPILHLFWHSAGTWMLHVCQHSVLTIITFLTFLFWYCLAWMRTVIKMSSMSHSRPCPLSNLQIFIINLMLSKPWLADCIKPFKLYYNLPCYESRISVGWKALWRSFHPEP